MKYFVRAIKSLLYFIVIFAAIVAILFFFSSQRKAGLSITDMFEEGSLPKLLCFFVAVGAVYPAVAFFKRKLSISKDYAEYADIIRDAMAELGYTVESENGEIITFRQKSFTQRFFRLFCEDRITINISESPLVIEGYRKDVMRVMSILSYKIRQTAEPESEE